MFLLLEDVFLELNLNLRNISLDKFHNNLDLYGNTSAASIGIALDEAVQAGRIKKGDLILLVAFGAGLTWGSQIIRW